MPYLVLHFVHHSSMIHLLDNLLFLNYTVQVGI